MPEIVADAGVLISPGDDPALAEAMKTLLTDPEKHRWFSEKGIQRAAAFTWEKTAQETLKVYQRVQGV
jgi:glycosyltransferase involved in cell wall biosynthesis